MDRGHKNKPLLQYVTVPFPEQSEREMYEKRYKKMLDSQKPKKPPKISRDKVFEPELPPAKKIPDVSPKIKVDDIFISHSSQ
jgi:hypothetical protein